MNKAIPIENYSTVMVQTSFSDLLYMERGKALDG